MPVELEVPISPAPEAQTTETPAPKADDLASLPESWQSEIKSLRKEAADRRSKLSAYEKQEEDRKAATLSDIEKANDATTKATERASALENKLIERDATAALNAANIIDAELGLMAIRAKIIVTDGEATNLQDLVAELIKNKPHLVKAADPTKPVVPDTKSTSPSATPPAQSRGRVPGKI